MDAQVLQELVLIRWLVTAITAALVVYTVLYGISVALSMRQQRETPKADTFFIRGNALLNKGRLDELFSMCEQQLAEYPEDSGANWLKANIHYRRKEWNQALLCYRKAEEFQPGWSVEALIADLEQRVRDERSRDLKVVPSSTPVKSGASSHEDPGKGDDA